MSCSTQVDAFFFSGVGYTNFLVIGAKEIGFACAFHVGTAYIFQKESSSFVILLYFSVSVH
jgi:hypothetical protein